MAFVPEGQHDSSQARSAWNHEENIPVPAGRLNQSRLRLDPSDKNVGKNMFLAFEMRMLLSLPTTVPVAKAIQLTGWIISFGWQQGYGAFNVSDSQLPETIHYI